MTFPWTIMDCSKKDYHTKSTFHHPDVIEDILLSLENVIRSESPLDKTVLLLSLERKRMPVRAPADHALFQNPTLTYTRTVTCTAIPLERHTAEK
jgi:hypothetical protein